MEVAYNTYWLWHLPRNRSCWEHTGLWFIILGLTSVGQALEAPANAPSIISTKQPPTAYSRGLLSTPSDPVMSGNLLVTGNVTGGKHFQSTVPYTDTSRIQTSLATTSLDSFYRQAVSIDLAPQWSTSYVPYYSSSGSTTRMQVNQPIPLSPLQTAGRYMSQSEFGMDLQVGQFHLSQPIPTQTLASTTRLLPVLAPRQQGENQRSSGDGRDAYHDRCEHESSVLPTTEELLTEVSDNSIYPIWAESDKVLETETGILTDRKKWDMGVGFDNLISETTGSIESRQGKLPYFEPPGELKDKPNHLSLTVDSMKKPELGYIAGIDSLSNRRTKPALGLPPDRQTVVTREFQGIQGSADVNSQDRFESYMAAGKGYLKAGEPTKALDAFTLAVLLQNKHSQALAAKSFALLVLGEYTGSALFLGRTLKTSPEYAGNASKLVSMLGEELVKQRCLALQTILVDQSSPELLFLLGYLHYQLGDISLAYQSLQQALVLVQTSGTEVPGLRILVLELQARLS